MVSERIQMTTEIVPIAEATTGIVPPLDPLAQLEGAEKVVSYMAAKCDSPQFHANIQGRKYPKVEWWTTVGFALGLSPIEVGSKKIEIDDKHYMYEASIEVRRMNDGAIIASATAICSTQETAWGNRDEYAVKSMAATRATGKAYRIGLSFLAVMAGLEATPSDEVPPSGFNQGGNDSQAPPSVYGVCPIHGIEFFMKGKMNAPAHPMDKGPWCAEDKVKAAEKLATTALLVEAFGTDHAQAQEWLLDNNMGLEITLRDKWTAADWNDLGTALAQEAQDYGPDITEGEPSGTPDPEAG
jgi:hypothetical protein